MLIDCPVVSAVLSGSVHVTVCPELVHEIAFAWGSLPVAPAESSVTPVGSVSATVIALPSVAASPALTTVML